MLCYVVLINVLFGGDAHVSGLVYLLHAESEQYVGAILGAVVVGMKGGLLSDMLLPRRCCEYCC